MIVTVIGLGLIGGSMAIDLKKRGFAKKIIGVDADNLHAQTALKIGFIDEIADFENGISQADIIILATPVNHATELLPKILDRTENQIVTDVCSTKSNICVAVSTHRKRANYVAGHPMAGTEFSGPWAAVAGLFDGKAGILCDISKSSDHALNIIKSMYETLNLRQVFMESSAHDVHAAYVSHISHITSFALALTVLDKERNDNHIFDLAGGGFRSTVRLAKSSAEMWVPIFEENSQNVIEVLDTYIEKMQLFRDAISKHETSEIRNLILNANKIKRVV